MDASIYHNGSYLAANPHWHAEDAKFKARWIEAILARNGIVPRHVVDVGSGSGEVLVELAKAYPDARMEGFDISPQAHAIAAPKAGGNLAFELGEYERSQPGAPDLLMAIDVFEHVENYIEFVRTIRAKAELKLFHIPLDLSVQGVLRGTPIARARELVGHLHYFTKETALATLADCGLEVIDWNYTHSAETMPASTRTRLFNVVRRIVRSMNEDFGVRMLGGASLMVLTR